MGREMPLVETRRELEWTDSAGKVRKSGEGDEPFGEMLSGFSVLDKIADEPTYGPETWNKPVKMPVIRKITVE